MLVQFGVVGALLGGLYLILAPSPEVVPVQVGALVAASAAAFAVLGVLLRIRLTVPIERFREDLQIVTRGNLDHKIVAGWHDELSGLADGFNELTDQLKRSRDRLREYNRTLERGVEERTHELARRNLDLNRAYREKEAAYDELRDTQAQMLQQERMATLGQLLAGIAHEINNPVNFMVNAIRPLESNVARIQTVLGQLEDGPSGELSGVMEDINASVDLIRKGADRTANIVQNLRTFSRSEGGEFRVTDLSDGLDITLSLLAHTIKGRIEVVKEYDSMPAVECSPGEINQVFMNLLSNACQAIEGPGTIWIRAEASRDGLSVFIQDSGHGISEDDLARIFEPFYTTKEAGIGTGLGLAITSNIIQKHGGRLEVASVPGETTEFEVWLPLRQDPQRWRTGETVLPAAAAEV